MKQLIPAFLITALAGAALAAPPEITNVRAEQRDGAKLVDIWYDAADADGDLLKIRIEVSDNDGARYSVPAFSLTGDIGEGIAPGANKHIVWDAGTDWDGEYSDKMRVKVFAVDAKGYPGLEWGDEVPPGGFLLGQDGSVEGSGPSRHVNIPWSYWLSKYEITVGQYCDFLNLAFALHKVERSGYASVWSVAESNLISNVTLSVPLLPIGDDRDIRWNVSRFEVVGGRTNFPVAVTWYGARAFAEMYGCDLPTEAEWEKAARGPENGAAFTHRLYTWGDELNAAAGNFASAGPWEKGRGLANGYGLCDMCGNLAEWTRTKVVDGEDIETYPTPEDLLSSRHTLEQDDVLDKMLLRGGSYSNSNIRIITRTPVPKVQNGLSEDWVTISKPCSATSTMMSASKAGGRLSPVGLGIVPGSVSMAVASSMIWDDGNGNLVLGERVVGAISYAGGSWSINEYIGAVVGTSIDIAYQCRIRELSSYYLPFTAAELEAVQEEANNSVIMCNVTGNGVMATSNSGSGRLSPVGLGLVPGSIEMHIGPCLFSDDGNGNLVYNGTTVGTISYANGSWDITENLGNSVFAGTHITISYQYSKQSFVPPPGHDWKEAGRLSFDSLNGFRVCRRYIPVNGGSGE